MTNKYYIAGQIFESIWKELFGISFGIFKWNVSKISRSIEEIKRDVKQILFDT